MYCCIRTSPLCDHTLFTGCQRLPASNFPPSVFSKLNLHNWGWSCFPFTLHNSWGPWQLLYHWLVITHGTPLWSHPWDLCDRKTKAVKGQGYKEPVWPPWMHLWGHKEALKGKLSVVELAVLLKHNALEALEDSDVWCWHQDWPASCSATLIMFSEIYGIGCILCQFCLEMGSTKSQQTIWQQEKEVDQWDQSIYWLNVCCSLSYDERWGLMRGLCVCVLVHEIVQFTVAAVIVWNKELRVAVMS